MSSIQLFVGRLPREIRSSELEEIFEKYGKLSRCDIKRGTNLSFGFVEFEDSNNANSALENCNGMPVNGERIVVEIAKRPARKRDDAGCFRCGNEGHWARDCPEPGRDDNGGRGGSSNNRRRHRSRSPRRSHSGSRMRGRDNDRRHGGDRRDRDNGRDRDSGRGNRRRQGSASRSPSRRGFNGRRGAPRNDRPSNSYGDRSNGRNRSPRRQRNRGGSRSPVRGRRDSPGKRAGGGSNGFEARSGDSAVGNSPDRMDDSYE
ncbi:hypothetical protein IW140_001212 [Coemansia sp. RSA 1813]|nr:hypothetical protein LPJ74_001731 [Coemansia sp. RSA 1843]KAJ2216861.1 hypothetical protein EV179_000895 [Coemansia sp. RSA 487]KAJ2571863.1 hypothetical protein IW140_001212 [Coemansia sp. RSA 1813]